MSNLYLIRHGQASFGEENYDRLSPTGVVQAEIVARQWVNIGRKIDAIYMGSMKRQVDTADALVCAYRDKQMLVPEIIIDTAFDEYDSGSVFEAQLPGMIAEDPSISEKLPDIFSNRRVFQLLFQEAMNRWVSGDYDIPEVTSWCGFKQRVKNVTRHHVRIADLNWLQVPQPQVVKGTQLGEMSRMAQRQVLKRA